MEWFGVDTYFSVFQRPFPDQIKRKLKTIDFLISCQDFLILLENLGIVFAFPRINLQKHVQVLSKKYCENYEINKYIEDMILTEKNEYKLEVTDALLSLRRNLQFFLEFFEGICNDETLEEDISVFAKASYIRNLERYQTCCSNFLYKCAIAFLPSRKKFLTKITFDKENSAEFALYDMNDFTISLRSCLEHLIHFYIVNGLEWEYKR
ncbi:hypothetical protein RN001_011791 [Aquatica leii]|uniref:Glycolipid transfer protein domain-containing protein n=1 Tax=Aquatica leii TaxID=1421715 RepID=A0AAN7SES9_9COLE|nr:hypothetical protein RN001_011791 [Aquatica leii]